MKILLTGGSSFTGYWFIRALRQKGHSITATFRGSKESYTGLRKQRLDEIAQWAELVWDCPFGDERFLHLLDDGYDILCHHGAQVENYKSLDFDVTGAVHSNTFNCRKVLEKAVSKGLKRVILTGSVFEANEGGGTPPLIAFSPYGLSKTATWETFRFWCWKYDIPLGKFVIPNPFGPYEEPRFCHYLLQTWIKGETPVIKTPDYVRDNIHVSLLAAIYAGWVGNASYARSEHLSPSGYVQSQGAFAERFAGEIQRRLRLECPVRSEKQQAFEEPLVRVGIDTVVLPGNEWNEQASWDELAEYYKRSYGLS